MKLKRKEYFALYHISKNGATDISRLKKYLQIEDEEIIRIIDKLSNLKLIKKSFYKHGNFVFTENTEGENTLKLKMYENWFIELQNYI